MKDRKKFKGLMKKAVAAVLGVTMAFGALMLPCRPADGCWISVSAATEEDDDCKFHFVIKDYNGYKSLSIYLVQTESDTVKVPAYIDINGISYTVTMIGDDFLRDNTTVKTLILPDTIDYIGDNVLCNSSIENITLSEDLEHIGYGFASKCNNIKTINCGKMNLQPGEVGSNILGGSDISNIKNENNAVCFDNWLIKYDPGKSTELKFADLGDNGTKIEYIAPDVWVKNYNKLKAIDIEGIKYIGNFTLGYCDELSTILNDDSLKANDATGMDSIPWFENNKAKGMVKLGSILYYYKTESPVIDVTTDEFKGIDQIKNQAFCDCQNAETFVTNSDINLDSHLFYRDPATKGMEFDVNDPLPQKPFYKIKKIYVDGELFEYSEDERVLSDLFPKLYSGLKGTQWLRDNAEKKIKQLFEQLDINYYGIDNDKIGTLSKTEEFYNFLKIHDYISIYPYDEERKGHGDLDTFFRGGKLKCSGYANLFGLLLESSGVRYINLSDLEGHTWDEIKIGDGYYESDDGWDAQGEHDYRWFGLSSAAINKISPAQHICRLTFSNRRGTEKIDRIIAERTIGDIDGNEERNANDSVLLWNYLKGSGEKIDEIAADINFDGVIDVTDAVLLENFVSGTALDVDNIPSDGLAPGFKVAFVNGTDYDNIKYAYTDRDGYIVLPAGTFEAPEGKKLSYDIGKVGQKVKIHNPCQVIQTKWADENEPDYSEPESSSSSESGKPSSSSKPDSSKPESSKPDSSRPDDDSSKLGDVNGDGTIDIEDAVCIIQHINGLTPLTDEQESRADVSKDAIIDIDDAVILISYINGNSTF